jgi:hypothetical protein
MYDAIQITKLLIFGTDTPSPSNYDEHIRPRDITPPSISYSTTDYMTKGGGRFAYPSIFGAVQKFFTTSEPLKDGEYSWTVRSSLAEVIC